MAVDTLTGNGWRKGLPWHGVADWWYGGTETMPHEANLFRLNAPGKWRLRIYSLDYTRVLLTVELEGKSTPPLEDAEQIILGWYLAQ